MAEHRAIGIPRSSSFTASRSGLHSEGTSSASSFLQTQELRGGHAHRAGHGDILKKYWGYPSFRTLDVYDMNALDRGGEGVRQVSQERIIAVSPSSVS